MDIVACCVMPKTQIHLPFKSDIQFNVILFLSDYVWGDLWKLLHRWHCYWWCSHYRWNLSRYNSNCYHLFSNASLFPFIGSISRWPSGSTENFKNVIKNSLSLSRQTHIMKSWRQFALRNADCLVFLFSVSSRRNSNAWFFWLSDTKK